LENRLLKTKSLRKTVKYLVLIFTLIFAFVVAIVSATTLFNMKIESMEHNQRQLLKQVKFDVNKFINQIEKISKYMNQNFDKKDFFIQNIINMHQSVSTVLILDKSGKVDSIHSNCDKKIVDFTDYSKELYQRYLADSKLLSWSDIHISTIDKEPSFTYSFRVKNKIVVVFISLKDLSLLTSNLVNSDGSHMIRILDSKGAFIINHDKPSLVSSKFNASNSEVFKELIEKNDEYEINTFDNICYGTLDYGMYTTLEKTNWKIIIRQNYSLVESYLFKIIVVILLIISLFTLLAIYFSSKFLNRVFKSLDKFQVQTSNIANGNYDKKLEPTSFDEFNKLFLSFEKMRYEINQRENNLQNSVENFRTLINSTMEGLIIHDTRKCISINDVALTILGYKNKNEVIGSNIDKYISPRYRKLIKRHFKYKKFTKEPVEYEIVTKDKKIRTVLGKGQSIFYEGKELRISAFLDITNMKSQEKILFQQSKMASIGEMLHNIAHQWRQPLSSIRTISSGMKLEKELGILNDNKFNEAIENISSTTLYLSQTIDDFSNYFNPNKKIEVFDLSEVINTTLSFLTPVLKENEINIIQSYENKVLVKGFQSELTQALINIINNSKDAFIINKIENRNIIISIYEYNEKIILSLKDSAQGIKKENLSKIFEPYFTTKHKYKGTGIGLYMTHQIITEHMDGLIYAKNTSFELDKIEMKGLEIVIELHNYK